MIVLIDTDVIIDVALDRSPYVKFSVSVINAAEKGNIDGYIAWHSIANFYYLVASASGDKKTRIFIKELLQFIKVSKTSTEDILYAIDSPLKDFEDALQLAAAKSCMAKYIITRNIKHYKKSSVPAITPENFLKINDLY
jgi:predicted nucleic acid-binding protein